VGKESKRARRGKREDHVESAPSESEKHNNHLGEKERESDGKRVRDDRQKIR